jgi:hypothetical protein
MQRLMKITTPLAACLLALAIAPAMAQPSSISPPRPPPGLPGRPPANPDELTKFDLDFAGGTPKALVAAIQKALGRSLNAIVPEEFAEVKLPALKMEHVNVAQLFEALAASGLKSEAVHTTSGYPGFQGNYQVVTTGYGFRQGSQTKISDDTIWYFYVEKPVLPPLSSTAKVCRFYSLAPYLDHHLTVDDITTAIETGWKMLGESPLPTISFHKDTRLLIGVGEPSKLETIDAVLKALELPKPAPPPPVSAPAAKSAEKAESDK